MLGQMYLDSSLIGHQIRYDETGEFLPFHIVTAFLIFVFTSALPDPGFVLFGYEVCLDAISTRSEL